MDTGIIRHSTFLRAALLTFSLLFAGLVSYAVIDSLFVAKRAEEASEATREEYIRRMMNEQKAEISRLKSALAECEAERAANSNSTMVQESPSPGDE